jgi:hypothetical protein
MLLDSDYLGSVITHKLLIAIQEKFNEVQVNKFIEWVNNISKRKFEDQPYQYIIKKDNDGQIVIFYRTTRFNGIGRCDTLWVTIFDRLGNVETFEEGETCEDFRKWFQRELSKQLYLNSEKIIFIYKDGLSFVEQD